MDLRPSAKSADSGSGYAFGPSAALNRPDPGPPQAGVPRQNRCRRLPFRNARSIFCCFMYPPRGTLCFQFLEGNSSSLAFIVWPNRANLSCPDPPAALLRCGIAVACNYRDRVGLAHMAGVSRRLNIGCCWLPTHCRMNSARIAAQQQSSQRLRSNKPAQKPLTK